ncbi:MAG: HAMP domain-containing histidine kinase [Robiginitomaculum sp.]|nr:HAMP domain-containing histidine kinase [Robiginitomaculum sp.]
MKTKSKYAGLNWQNFLRSFAMPISWLCGLPVVLGLMYIQSPGSFGLQLLFVAIAAAIPAIMHLTLGRFLREEWAQALVLIGWASFAALAIASPGNLYTPLIALAVLPIIAAASFGGMRRVLEATALTAIIVVTIAIAATQGLLPQSNGLFVFWPGLELASLVLSLIVIGAGMASVLPVIDSSARLREGLFQKSLHLDFCIDRSGHVIAASDQGRKWSSATALSGLLRNKNGEIASKKAIDQVFVNNQPASLVVPVGTDGKSHLLQIRQLNKKLVLVNLRNISALLAKEKNLIRQRDEAIQLGREKTMFLASMSHELRTPLNAIIGFSDMMKARLFGPIPAKYAEYADLIHESGRHLVDLVGDVLDVSKIESEHYKLDKENFDLNEIVRACVKLMQMTAEEAGVRSTVEVPDYQVPVIADRKAMRQILFNLLSNAIKFTPGGGTITTKVSLNGNKVTLNIVDDGVGMSKEDASRVGQPYQQAQSAKASDARGTGLGLSLVKALAELHDGQFKVQSELGQGTSISLELPILDQASMKAATVKTLDARSHILRAQAAAEQIAAVTARISS